MDLPINNRIRAQYVIPQEVIENSNIPDGLMKQMNRQLTVKIAEELLKHKPEIIEQSTIKHNHPYYNLDHYSLQAEVFVFTRDELDDLIRRVQIEISTQIREQMTLVDNWKNK